MYVVKPFTWEALWGDTRLHAYGADPTKDKVGILFTVSGIEGIDCEIENEEEKTTLMHAVKKDPAKFGLLKGEEYPLIIAFDSIGEDVSFQIHPTDEFARTYNGGRGKPEAWGILDAPEDGSIEFGHHAKTREEFKEWTENREWDKLLRYLHTPINGFIEGIKLFAKILLTVDEVL